MGDGAPVPRFGFRMSTGSYACDVRAVAKQVSKGVERNADPGINVMQDAIDFCMQKLMIRLENQWVTDFFAASLWTTTSTLSGTSQWSDVDDSDPITAIDNGLDSVESLTGLRPNVFVVGAAVDLKLKRHPLIRDLYKVTNTDSISDEMMARVCGVQKYLVARAVEATNLEAATAAYGRIAGKHALLAHVAPDGSDGATAGKVFRWNGWGNDAGVAVNSYYEEQTRSTIVEAFAAVDFKITSADLGYMFIDAVA